MEELKLQPLNLPKDTENGPIVIAGPCSAESEEQVMTTAKQLADKGCHLFRAGVWKPRTKPGGFEGHGEPALKWMKRIHIVQDLVKPRQFTLDQWVGNFLCKGPVNKDFKLCEPYGLCHNYLILRL